MCEDFPCCGHERGCCPDFDESGKQLNMICVCGAKLPVNARYSICDSCMNRPDEDGYREYDPDMDDEESCDCGGIYDFVNSCGVMVCDQCDKHKGLARCYCGWSESGQNGRMELEEMGETIEPEDW